MAEYIIPASHAYFLIMIGDDGYCGKKTEDGRSCLFVFSSEEKAKLFSLNAEPKRSDCSPTEVSMKDLFDHLNEGPDDIQLLEFDNDGMKDPNPVRVDDFLFQIHQIITSYKS